MKRFKKTAKPYTQTEVELLNRGLHTNEEFATIMDRTPNAIKIKRMQMSKGVGMKRILAKPVSVAIEPINRSGAYMSLKINNTDIRISKSVKSIVIDEDSIAIKY